MYIVLGIMGQTLHLKLSIEQDLKTTFSSVCAQVKEDQWQISQRYGHLALHQNNRSFDIDRSHLRKGVGILAGFAHLKLCFMPGQS